jgi:hypothetical protein
VYTIEMLETTEQTIEISREDIANWQIFLGLPCYDMSVTEPFFMSMIKTVMGFKEIGLKFALSTISDSLISRARNQLVAKFLANPEFTHFMFIDVDLAFLPDDILKMLWHDKDIMTGAYPIKEINWNKVVENVNEGIAAEDLAKNSVRFVVNPVSNKSNTIRVDKGALEIYDAGTGFMLIKREVFLRLIEAYPELKYNDDTGVLKGDEKNWSYAFFNSYIDEDTGRFLSEDYGFGRYWQKIGGEVWVDPAIELTHLGRFAYQGRMLDFIQKVGTFVQPDGEKIETNQPKPTGKKKKVKR